ncbi:MAG: TRAP transporter small permease [Burkholderiales bacterium]|nr:TRAP transporter small permease [Burkholderiales bacterium]
MPARTDRAIESAARALHLIGAAAVALLTAVILYDAGGRLLLNRPFPGTTELAANALVLITFLQLPYAIWQRQLLRVTFLVERVPAGLRAALDALAYGVGAGLFAAVATVAWSPLVHSVAAGEFYGTDAFRIPAWPLRAATFGLWLAAALVCARLAWLAGGGRLRPADESAA